LLEAPLDRLLVLVSKRPLVSLELGVEACPLDWRQLAVNRQRILPEVHLQGLLASIHDAARTARSVAVTSIASATPSSTTTVPGSPQPAC
jgi:hypothetical protein